MSTCSFALFVVFILGKAKCEDPGHWKLLQKHIRYLHENLETDSLLTHLLQENVLKRLEYEQVKKPGSTRADKVEILVTIMRRKSLEQFTKFCDALDKCGQSHIRETLEAIDTRH